LDLTLLHAGTDIRLGRELGRGGEGTVHELQEDPGRVAKRYAEPADPRKVRKLVAMTLAANPALLGIAAWPSDLLKDSNGAVWGFVMPRVASKQDIHELYSPKSRSEAFPQADFRLVVHVAANVAKAFAVLHAQGHVVGDVNHGFQYISEALDLERFTMFTFSASRCSSNPAANAAVTSFVLRRAISPR